MQAETSPTPTNGVGSFISELDRLFASEDKLADYRPVFLRPILEGDLSPTQPTMLERTDGKHLLYTGKRHWFQGEPESGKSWCALLAVKERLEAGETVAYVDWESTAPELVGRLRILGVSDDDIERGLRYISPPGPVLKALEAFHEAFSGASLVVFDACTEAMVNEGLNPEKNADVELWAQQLPRLALRFDAAYIVIDHVTKAFEGRGRFAIGGGHKLGLTDVAYSFRVVDLIAPGQEGRVRVKVEKDRPGGVRAFALDRKEAADMVLDATNPGVVTGVFFPPKEWSGPTKMMEEMVEQLQKHPEAPLSKTAIAQLVRGKKETKLEAVQKLIMDGRIENVADRGTPKYQAAQVVPE